MAALGPSDEILSDKGRKQPHCPHHPLGLQILEASSLPECPLLTLDYKQELVNMKY